MNCKDRSVILDRLELLENGRNYPGKYGISLPSQFYLETKDPVSLKVLKNTGRIKFEEVQKKISQFRSCSVGDTFGDSWDTHWFMIEIEVPEGWLLKKEEVHFIWNSSSEALLYNIHGKPLQGFTGENSRMHRDEYCVYKEGVKNDLDASRKVRYFVEMACLTIFGCFVNNDMCQGPDPHKKFRLNSCHVLVFNREAWELYWDFHILAKSARYLDTTKHSRADDALLLANKIVNACEPKDTGSYEYCRSVAKKFLQVKNTPSQHQIYAVGHCHIDMGWLWPFIETRRKGARSWAAQTELMKLYPKYNFIASSSGLYEWIKEDYPSLFEEIIKYAKDKRFQPIGGSYLEFDANIPSGESMARQMLYGQRFFKKYFGMYSDTLHLPDTFGFSAQLPQLMSQCRMSNFLTQKLKWNKFNNFPHTSFNWKGIDGSVVFTHFPSSDTQVAWGDVEEVIKSQENFKDKGRSNCSLMLFGIGDGGGGPLPAHLEKLSRMEDVDGLPKVKLNTSVTEFFDEVKKSKESLMTWDNELYFEFHNGTYTTMANNKKYNRKAEYAIRAAEMFATIVCATEGKNARFNTPLFEEAWRKIMLYQFHDVIPGTSIELIYQETEKQYPLILKSLSEDLGKSFDSLLKGFAIASFGDKTENSVALFNSLHYNRTEPFEWINDGARVFSMVTVPGIGCAIYPKEELKKSIITKTQITLLEKDHIEIESPLLKVILSKTGRVISLKDKTTMEYNEPETMKEVIGRWEPYNGGNILLLHGDLPVYWDSWDLWIYYQESSKELLARSYSIEKALHQIKVTYKYVISEKSTMEQTIIINAYTKRVDFSTVVNWNETHKVLRTYFPLNIRSDYVTCDIQSGNLRRPTTSNTSWEVAKYEICCHKYLDYSDGGYGVSLMSESKYGYSARGSVAGISLLKAAKIPYDKADVGTHSFTYSLYPHSGVFSESNVVEEAYKLNEGLYPKWLSTNLTTKKELTYIKIDKPNVILDALKLDEEKRNQVVMRVHEEFGSGVHCTVKPVFRIDNPKKTNILEEETSDWEIVEAPETTVDDVAISLKPFQIATYKMDANIK